MPRSPPLAAGNIYAHWACHVYAQWAVLASSEIVCPMGSMSEDVNRAWNDRYMLRMPDGLRDRIKAAAEASGRSMNSEIVRVLEEQFPPVLDRADPVLELLDSAIAKLEAQSPEPGSLKDHTLQSYREFRRKHLHSLSKL